MDSGDTRAARLAAALRDNLRKRKAQARAATPDDPSAPSLPNNPAIPPAIPGD